MARITMPFSIDFEKYLDNFFDAILIIDSASRIVFSNLSSQRLFLYSEIEFNSLSIGDLSEDCLPISHREMVNEFINSNSYGRDMYKPSHPDIISDVILCKRSDGSSFHTKICISRMEINGKKYGVAHIKDYSSICSEFISLREELIRDDLTGLYNTRILDGFSEKTKNKFDSIAIAYCDICKFKEINDTYGHDVGDYILREFSIRLKEVLGIRDMAVRIGGDEFVIIYSISRDIKDRKSYITDCVKKISKIMETPFIINKKPIFLSVSIGVVLGCNNYRNINEIIKEADTAMYESKKDKLTFKFISNF
ncbi:sensor domain-containing diguanylate cyclase [Vibrio cidicii]|nr:sensor domain-containing diguanylate cyclase [Vibrio cidicii]